MRYFLTLTMGLMMVFGPIAPALGHSKMSKSDPAEGAIIKPGLSEITLGFTKSVRVMVVKVNNETAKTDVTSELEPKRAFAMTLTFPVMPLKPGAHAVTWTAVAKDGHVMKGTLKFSVKE